MCSIFCVLTRLLVFLFVCWLAVVRLVYKLYKCRTFDIVWYQTVKKGALCKFILLKLNAQHNIQVGEAKNGNVNGNGKLLYLSTFESHEQRMNEREKKRNRSRTFIRKADITLI